MKWTSIALTALFSIALIGCASKSGTTEATVSNYGFSREDRQAAMKEYGFNRIQPFKAKARKKDIASGDAARKEASCKTAALGLAQVTGFSMSGSGNRKESASIVHCRSTRNEFEECECDVGFK
ncbi:MAG: hypothetical protein KDK25_03040 [Leptospiraceae bacterium]|nr:hypothetical protein [Leptospiraceae bacterium]